MGNILYYLAHDPVGNCEWQVSDFDRSALAKNAENNIVFIAVDESGNREIVDEISATIILNDYLQHRQRPAADGGANS